MKRNLLLIMSMLTAISLNSQTYQQTDIELDSEIPRDKSVVFEASTSLKLLDGFRCDPNSGKSAVFSIDRFGVFPPDEGILGGPATSDQDGVVGALPGELNVSDLGAAVYSIPILMPQGIGNMTPEIAVTYNNQSGNGLLGWGWDITGLSSIVRTGQTLYHDGNQSAVNFVDDRFLIDGKRLMLCSGDYGGNGAIYKTEIDDMSKIVSYTDGYNGPARFVVQKKDGTRWEYGGTNDSRIETQRDNKIVMTWLVNKISDPDGNSIVYKYIENQNVGESYVDKIDYTLNNNVGIKTMYRVQFDYDDMEDVETGYLFGNVVQKSKILKGIIIKNMITGTALYDYSFSYLEPGNYSDDFMFMYYRLSSIGLTANGLKLNPTVISWNKKSHYPDKFLSYPLSQNVFNKVPFVGDFNGDGYSDVITVPYKLGNTYSNDVQARVLLNNGDGTFNENPCFTFDFDKTLEWVYVVDVNGDGLDDVVPYFANYDNNANWKSRIYVYINNRNGFTFIGEKKSTSRYFTVYPGDFCGEKKFGFFLDYNNHGFTTNWTPLVVYFKDGAIVSQSLGNQSYYDVPEHITIEDVNNDGCSEIIYMMEDRSAVCRLTYNGEQYGFNRLYYDNNIKSSDFLFPGDFNGDGYTDFLKYGTASYWEIVYSDGERLKTPEPCNNNLLQGLTLAPQDRYMCSLHSISIPSETIRTIDFDGDGKTDVGVFKSTGGNYYLEIGFNNFKDIRRFYLNINHSHQFIHIGNFLGHENVSILGSVRNNPYTNEIPKIVSINPHSSKFSVERITDGMGNAQGFAYQYLTPKESFYEYDYQWVGNDMRTIALPLKALCADTTFSTNDTPCINKYSYKNVWYHPNGHGLLGVERVESKLLINNSLVEANALEKDIESMAENCMLIPKAKMKYNYSNMLISSEQYTYIKCKSVQNQKVVMPLLTVRKTVDYDCDKANGVLKSTIENIDYQSDVDYNNYFDVVNVGDVITGYDDNYTGDDAVLCQYWTETEYDYDNNPSEWVVCRPRSIRCSQRLENNDIIGSCDVFEYGGSDPYKITHKISLPNPNMDFTDPLRVEADYKYDAVGHVEMQSLASPSAKGQRMTRVNYGEEYNYRFPTSKTNENGWENVIAYDVDYGNVTSVLDYNQFVTESSADPLEITVEKSLPDGMRSAKAKRWAAGNKHAPQNASYYLWEKTSGHAATMAFFNKNGMKLRDVTFGLNGEAIYIDMTYDDVGNMLSKSMPYKVGDDVNNYYYVYDKNNRLIQEVHPNGLTKFYSYDKLTSTINTVSSDGVSHIVSETTNAAGWRTQTVDIGGNTINYEYFSDGKLKSAMIGDNPRTKIEYEYDNQRNVRKIKDLSKGETLYEYNAFGELKEKRTPNGGVTSYDYDNMGNLIWRVENDGRNRKDVVTQWIYDDKKGKVGMLSKIIYGDSQVILYNYDDLLRMTSVTEVIGGADYTTKYTYDNANREECVTYPSGVMIQKKYSNSGYYKTMVYPKKNTVLWQTDSADAMGNISDYQLGNGLNTHREYDVKTGLLTSINTNSNNNVFQDLLYSYDDFGNLTSRAKMTGMKQIERFKYDRFNRLEEIRLNNVLKGAMGYDNYGNIQSKISDGEEVFYEAHYDGVSPYAVSRVKTDLPDFAGMNNNIEYTVFDKIAYLDDGNNSLSIEYGYDYSRIHSVEHSGGRICDKVYVSDCEYVIDNNDKFVYTYLSGPMGVFAVCRTGSKGDINIFYIHKDHLDSWCLVTDESGKIVQRTSYDAWGNPRNENTWSGGYDEELLCDRGFTGHEHLTTFGIINMNGRAYDPMLSMMMSPDDYIQSPDFSQNFNRYIYCYNNPLSYCDPSGEWVEWLLYGIYNGVVNVIYNLDCIDSFAEGALSFGAGFVSGCLTEGLSNCSWIVQVAGKVTSVTLQKGVNSFVKYNTGNGLDANVLENKEFKSELMYGFSAGLVSGVMNSYITQPADGKEGVSLGSMLCKNKAERKLLEQTTAKIAGNLFSGRYMFHGLEISKDNWKDVVPYFKCVMGVASNGIEFEGHSEVLGNVFNKLLNFDFSGMMNKWGSDMDNGYSQFRSLFIKNG